MWRYRLRSSLVVACAALGVAGIITSVDYAASGRRRILEQIQQLGTNVILVRSEQSRAVAGRAKTGTIVTTLREPDYAALRRTIDYVRSSAIVTQTFRLKAGDLSKVAPVIGCEPALFSVKSWRVDAGEVFDATDLRRSARVALIGHTIATDLFGSDPPVGRRLFINRVPFQVVGVLAERGQGLDVENEDEQVYIPLTTAMRRLSNVDYFNALVFELADWKNMNATASRVADVLDARHRVRAGQREDFQIQNQREILETQVAASARLAYFIQWIGFSGLIVSGLGVLAIAWIAVRARTVEIGTRRALGATATHIFAQFVFEAFALAALGCIAGIFGGVAMSRIAAARAGLPSVFERGTAFAALAMALGLNLLFAAGPALRAARLDPASALRHE
jgi:putative ABC transport system permease protein